VQREESEEEDDGKSEDCPNGNGYFPDEKQCDKYLACK
jgi:hypothetical protein